MYPRSCHLCPRPARFCGCANVWGGSAALRGDSGGNGLRRFNVRAGSRSTEQAVSALGTAAIYLVSLYASDQPPVAPVAWIDTEHAGADPLFLNSRNRVLNHSALCTKVLSIWRSNHLDGCLQSDQHGSDRFLAEDR